jgi:nitrate reductase gamma subunit
LPLVTGLMLYARIGAGYEIMLAWHILSFELLLVWFPFSKLMHAFTWIPSRFQLGAHFQRRGVKA